MPAGCIVDLFSGAGGFSLGANLAGFEPLLSIDFDSDLTYSHSTNFPNVHLAKADLHLFHPKDLLKLAGKNRGAITGVLGGPPCQGFSYMGKRDPEDPRNRLVLRFFEYVDHIEPAFFVLENVLGLLTEPFIGFLHDGLEKLQGRYRILDPFTLNAAEFGAATSRRRAFVVGYRRDRVDDLSVEDFRCRSIAEAATVYEAIHDLPSPRATVQKNDPGWACYPREPEPDLPGEYARRARRFPPAELSTKAIRANLVAGKVSGFKDTKHTDRVLKRFVKVKPGQRDEVSKCPRLSWHEQCHTLRAGTGKDRGSYQSIRPIHPKDDRVITVREAARIQGFPDWFQFHPTKWHSFRMIGNSVPPPLAEHILRVIAAKVSNGTTGDHQSAASK